MDVNSKYDLLIKNVRIVRPQVSSVETGDIAVRDGKIVSTGTQIPAESARNVVDGKGRLAFPGLVDAHMHTGIYSPLAEDALTESRAAAMGGVTTSLNYMRTGQYYLNKGGPYAEFFPEVLETSKDRFYVDYAYHLAPVDGNQIKEIPMLIEKFGVTSFKIFMFYGSYGLHGASAHQNDFLMIGKDEKYDVAHFEFVMRGVTEAMRSNPATRDYVSLSLHCETPEIMAAYTKIVRQEGKLEGLRAYSAARPPHSEGLAVCIASYLAHETECVNINLLHLTSRKAIDAALTMADAFPHINFRREVTAAHLVLDYDAPTAAYAKVNPPIRSREDVEYLWEKLLEGKIDWVCSDHACCKHELKLDKKSPKEVFLAKSGFGGAEYLLTALITEGSRRGLSLNRVAELTSWNPARRYGLPSKGDLAAGFDADIVLVDPNASHVVRAAESPSAQGYTPFEGIELTAKVTNTFLRGQLIYDNGNIVGEPRGQYLKRPY